MRLSLTPSPRLGRTLGAAADDAGSLAGLVAVDVSRLHPCAAALFPSETGRVSGRRRTARPPALVALEGAADNVAGADAGDASGARLGCCPQRLGCCFPEKAAVDRATGRKGGSVVFQVHGRCEVRGVRGERGERWAGVPLQAGQSILRQDIFLRETSSIVT